MDERRIQTTILVKAYLKELIVREEVSMGEYVNRLIEEDMRRRGLI